MYLSQITLNLRSRQVQSELTRPYEMHRTLMQAFPDGLRRGPADDETMAERVLFRLDVSADQGARVLVQSHLLPDWSALKAGYAIQIEGPKAFAPQFVAGQRLAFRLRANPTVKQNGKRHGLHDEEAQRQWLMRKANDGGFAVLQVRISNERKLNDSICRSADHKHELNLLSVQFDGELVVQTPDQFGKTLANGIGSAKGMGFGLLSLARL